jgi:hypothetical protein
LGFSAGGPSYLPAIFVVSAKPNKMAEDKTIPDFKKLFHPMGDVGYSGS